VYRTLTSALIGLGLAGCSAFGPVPGSPPTAMEPQPAASATAPPVVELPSEPTATAAPFNLATPPIVIEHAAEGEAPSATPPGVRLPPAQLTIFRPGPASQVISPFQVYGRGGPSFNERVTIRLYGEDGRLISEKITYLLVYPGRAGNFVAQIAFETPFVAEAARLEVSTQDPRYGRLAQLASVELVLLSTGFPRVHPQLEGPEKLAILSPQAGAQIQGGVVQVRGAGWAASDQPLTIELLDRNGSPLARQPIWFDSEVIGQAGSFAVDLSYQIPFAQYARLALSEQSFGIPGTLHYSSVEIWLQP